MQLEHTARTELDERAPRKFGVFEQRAHQPPVQDGLQKVGDDRKAGEEGAEGQRDHFQTETHALQATVAHTLTNGEKRK